MEADDAGDDAAEKSREDQRSTAGGCLAMTIVAAVLFAGCFAMVGGDDDPSGGVDGAAELACERYRTAADEARTLTAPELREKLKDVNRLARNSGNSALASAGEDMLAEFTNGTTDDFLVAVGRFGEICGRLGV